MSTVTSSSSANVTRLLPHVTCPHCWNEFPPQDSYWISEHQELIGDERFSETSVEQLRFLPSHFTPDGQAIDARGFTCYRLACPRCHLEVPRSMLEMKPIFISIFGAPASGKTYFLGAMTHMLRQVLPLRFSMDFFDAEASMNRMLKSYESDMFVNREPDKACIPNSLIRKTEQSNEELYSTVRFQSQTVTYTKPFIFNLSPNDRHKNSESAALKASICLYDNAGESFQPGQDRVDNPVTRHMSKARLLCFMFDPLQDVRFLQRNGLAGDNYQQRALSNQEEIFQEAAGRIRRYAQIPQTKKHDAPLVVIVTKSDRWGHLLGPLNPINEPYVADKTGKKHAIDIRHVRKVSDATRELLLRSTPEIVTAAESFAREVVYIPISTFGHEALHGTSEGQIRPRDINPVWVSVPIVFALGEWFTGYIPTVR